jgi:hypothetical protein
MYRISGPIAIYALKIANKNIMLFGDMHESKDKQCASCNIDCMYVVDLLKKMKPKTDLFIESSIYSQPEYYRRLQPHDVIRDVVKTFHKDMHNHKGKSQGGVRVHYSDIRALMCFSPFDDLLYYMVRKYNYQDNEKDIAQFNTLNDISWCRTLDILKQFIDIMLTSDNYIEDVKHLIPHNVRHNFIYKNDLIVSKRKYVTRLKIQFQNLTKEQQILVLKFHEDKCKELKKKHSQYNVAMKHYNEKKQLSAVGSVALFNALLLWGSHLKDLYTIARMLYYFDRTDNIISYDGASHSKVYASFFKEYINAKVIHKENHYRKTMFSMKPKMTNGNEFRCVKLSKNVIQDVFNV